MKKFVLIFLSLVCIKVHAQDNIASLADVSTSYVSPWETLSAVNDSFTPANSSDREHGIYGNWPNPDSIQWVQYSWSNQYSINKVEIYWFEDGGGILIPTTAYLEYWNGSSWVRIADVPKKKDAFNTVTFANVITDSIRVSMKNTDQSTGIIEWRVYGVPTSTNTTKQLYIPNDWKDTNQNIPWDSVNRCKQSANFAVFWGPLAGNDPVHLTDPAIQFNPQILLDSMEDVYDDYINKWKLLPDSGTLAKYKIIIVMNNTWRDGLYTGYLFGGGFDNVIGAMFIDPGVASTINGFPFNNWGVSHEFTHSCQYMITSCLYPGHGFPEGHSGFFWETHAQFMAWQRIPGGLGNADPVRALNFTSYTMSSARKHYSNIYYLEMLKEKYGIDFIGRIWREADETNLQEHPFQTIQRLLGLDQNGINALFMEYAMRNVKWDYQRHDFIQQAMDATSSDFHWYDTDILDSIGQNIYAIPDNLAPQQYGYNIIKLFPSDFNCTQPYVHLKFKGHVDENASSGWLYAFVSLSNDSVITYSQQYTDSEVTYKFPSNTKEYFLVVMGAPTTFHVHSDLFEIGFPKEFRYPWQIRLQGMLPDGYQKNYINTDGIAGAPHPNGGGFVAATAHVDATAYVGVNAAVLDNAQVTGNAHVEGKARVRQYAVVSGNAVVKDFADVYDNSNVKDNVIISKEAKVFGTTISDSSTITDNAAVAYATISSGSKAFGNLFSYGGTINNHVEFGGDAELFSPCDAGGRYLQVADLEPAPGAPARSFCDGSYDNGLNIDTNKVYTYFDEAQMAFDNVVQCGNVTGDAGAPPIVNAGNDQQVFSGSVLILNGTASSPSGSIKQTEWLLLSGPGSSAIENPSSLNSNVNNASVGVYMFKLIATDNNDNQGSDTVVITVSKADELPIVNAGNDKQIVLPINYVTLVATVTDPDDNVQSLRWTQVSGPSNAYIISPGSLTCTMDNLIEGVYEFALTATDGYGLMSSDSVIVIVKKSDSTGAGNKPVLALYPNPANDIVIVTYPPTVGGTLTMFDAKGSKILMKQIAPDTSSVSFSVKQLANGVYYIRIDKKSGDKYKLKLIVTHR